MVNGLECCLLDLEAEPLDLELERTVDVTMRDDRLDGELVVGTPLRRDVVLEQCGDVEVLAGEVPKPGCMNVVNGAADDVLDDEHKVL